MLNLLRRPALLPGKAPRRVIVSRRLSSTCLPRVLSLPHLPRPASLLAGRDDLAMCVGSVCDYDDRVDVMRRSCGGWLIGSLTPRLSIAPLLDTDGGEGSGCRRCLLLSDFFCDARILWIALSAVAGAASPWYIVIVS